MTELVFRELTDQILAALIEIHRELGPGLLESAYEECLCFELAQRNILFQRQMPIPVKYKTVRLKCGYVADMIVDGKVLLELKSVDAIQRVHEAQLLTYLKLTGIKVGLLVNFNTPLLKDGIVRRVM
jgi:GxxExxY protein